MHVYYLLFKNLRHKKEDEKKKACCGENEEKEEKKKEGEKKMRLTNNYYNDNLNLSYMNINLSYQNATGQVDRRRLGLSTVVLSVEHDARRATVQARGAEETARPGGTAAASRTDANGSAGRGVLQAVKRYLFTALSRAITCNTGRPLI